MFPICTIFSSEKRKISGNYEIEFMVSDLFRYAIASISVLLILLFINGCASTPTTFAKLGGYHKDATGELASAADAIVASEPKLSWQKPIDALDVDEMIALPGNRVLAGMLRLSHDFGEPSYGPYSLVDMNTGSTLWEYARNSSVQYAYQVLVTSPVVLISRADSRSQRVSYFAINPENGREIWSHDLSARHDLALTGSGGMVVFAEATETGIVTEARNLVDGKPRWSTKNKIDPSSFVSPMLLVRDKSVVLLGNGASAYSLEDGRRLWQYSEAGFFNPQSVPLELDDAIAVVYGDRMLTLISNSGHQQWQQKLSANAGILGGDNNNIMVQLLGDAGAEDSIAAFDRSSGRKLWQHNAGGRLHSALLKAEGELFYTTRMNNGTNAKLHHLNAASGKTVFSVELDAYKGLPDKLLLYKQHVVVVTEHGPVAFRLDDGRPLWSHTFSPSFDSTDAYAQLYSLIRNNAQSSSPDEKKMLESGMQSMDKYRQQIDLSTSALGYRANVYQSTAATLSSSSSASSTARYTARQERIASTEFAMGMAQRQHNMDARASTLNAANALVDAGDALVKGMARELKEGPIRAEIARVQLKPMLAKRINLRSVQGNYFLCGLKKSGEVATAGFMVVDLRDGRWTEIATSPDHVIYNHVGVSMQLPVLSDQADQLVLKGIGSAKEKWEAIELRDTRAVGSSLLGYKIDMARLYGADMSTQFGGWGYIDHQGEYRISPGYSAAAPFAEGRAHVQLQGKPLLIDKKGKVIAGLSPLINEIGDDFDSGVFSDDRAVVSSVEGMCGYIDSSGRIVIPMKYRRCKKFSDGLAAVNDENNKLWAYINKKGEQVTKFEFSCAEPHQDGLALINVDPKPVFLNRCKSAENGKFGYLDNHGHIAIQPILWEAHSFNDGVAFVSRDRPSSDRSYGFIDKKGNFVLGPKFLQQTPGYAPTRFSDGLFGVQSYREGMIKSYSQFGYVNQAGNMLIQANPDFECVEDFHEGFARMRKNTFICISKEKGDWGYIDKQGKYLVEPRLKNAEDFSEGLALVREQGGQYGYIDKSGKFAIQPRFTAARSFSYGFAAVYVAGRLWFKK